jgi:hypothetical protein
MGTQKGLRALSSVMEQEDIGDKEWAMPWDVVAVDRLFVPRRRVGDSAKYVFAEHGLYIDDADPGQRRGKLHYFKKH